MEISGSGLKYPPIEDCIRNNTSRAVFEFAKTRLCSLYHEDEIRRIFFLLVEEQTTCPPHRMFEQNQRFHSSELILLFKSILRLSSGEPLAYVLGKTWFYRNEFVVNPAVLIPRPETEELTEKVIAYIHQSGKIFSLLDAGTGSGCIAITVKKYCPEIKVTGLDISEDALHCARRNSSRLNTEVCWINADLLSYHPSENWDIIVSNPPYIPQEESPLLPVQVREFEPPLALFSPSGPLFFYEALFRFSEHHLNAGGAIFLECHQKYARQVLELSYRFPFWERVQLMKDYSGQERFFVGIRKTDYFSSSG